MWLYKPEPTSNTLMACDSLLLNPTWMYYLNELAMGVVHKRDVLLEVEDEGSDTVE